MAKRTRNTGLRPADATERLRKCGTAQVLIELFDNARRAGANRIDVRVKVRSGGARIEVADDGRGCAEPEELLQPGRSGWRNAGAAAERPGGRGCQCLYDRNAAAESRTIGRADARDGWKRGEHAWRCNLGALEFGTGTVNAEPGRLDRAVGFSVAFDAPEDEHEARRMVRDAARFLSTEVRLDGTMCSQRPYTSGCASTAIEDGYRFGIIPRAAGSGPDLSLHGRLVCAFLPSVDTLEGA